MKLKMYNPIKETYVIYDVGFGKVEYDKYNHAFRFGKKGYNIHDIKKAPKWKVYEKFSEGKPDEKDAIKLFDGEVGIEETYFHNRKLRNKDGFREGDIYRATLLFLHRDKYKGDPDTVIAVPWNIDIYLLNNEGKTFDKIE